MEKYAVLKKELDCSIFLNDDMEISREHVKLYEVLGEGAFGLVKRGILQINDVECRDVAVKMLKDTHTIEDFKEFRHEIEVMKAVGRHDNIVGIIGHCTQNINEFMLLTEYCARGNLLNFIRTEWYRLSQKIYTSFHDTESYTPSLLSQKTPESVFNFDSSFIEKSFTYKNFSETPANPTQDNIEGKYLNTVTPQQTHPFKSTNLIINKLYDEFKETNSKTKLSYIKDVHCTNACKCKVDVIKNIITSDNSVKKTNCINCNDNELSYMDDEGCNEIDMPIDYIDNWRMSSNELSHSNETIAHKTKYKVEVKDCDCYIKFDDGNNVDLIDDIERDSGFATGTERYSTLLQQNVNEQFHNISCNNSNYAELKNNILNNAHICGSNTHLHNAKNINKQCADNNFVCVDGKKDNCNENGMMTYDCVDEVKEYINYRTLLSFAKQIACGMVS